MRNFKLKQLPDRTAKPRNNGLTMVMDKGLSLTEAANFIEANSEYVDLVKFHVGAENWRSRKAMEKLGAEFKGEVMVAYHGEPTKQNVEYWIKKENWK